MVTALGKFVTAQCTDSTKDGCQIRLPSYFVPPPVRVEDVIVDACQTICDWVVTADQWVLSSSLCMDTLLQAAATTLGAQKHLANAPARPAPADQRAAASPASEGARSGVSERVRDAGQFLLSHLCNSLGRFPSPAGARSASSLVIEEHALASLGGGGGVQGEERQYMRVYALDDSTLVTVVDAPRKTGVLLLLFLLLFPFLFLIISLSLSASVSLFLTVCALYEFPTTPFRRSLRCCHCA